MATFLECLRIFLKLVEKTVEIFIFDYELNFSYLKKISFLISLLILFVWDLQHWKWFSFLVAQVMPGLLLCFVLRYDAYKKSQLNSIEAGIPQPINTIQKITYFHCSLIGYFLGKSFQPHFFSFLTAFSKNKT